MTKKLIFTIFICLLTLSKVWAQAPNMINYQGVALNNSGLPIANTTIKLKVKIHTGTPTGTVQYYEERSVSTDASGLFDFQIDGPGKIIGAGTLASVNWSSGDKFLQIEIDPTNGNTFTDMGTQQLVSVPYANYSQSAEKLKLPYAASDGSSETFKITNTNLTGKGIVANVSNSGAIAIEANGGSGVAIKANSNSGGTSSIVATNTSGTAITANGSPISSSDGVLEVNATASAGYAIIAQSGGTSGTIRATNSNTSNNVSAIYGEANSVGQNGVEGSSTNGYGIYGSSVTGAGVSGASNNSVGVHAFSTNGYGLQAHSTNGKAIYATGATELNGTIKITGGNPGAGKVLTSDASGNATWKSLPKISFRAKNDILLASWVSHSVPSGLSPTTLKFPLVSLNDGAAFNSNSAATNPNTFIAPVNGVYQINATTSLFIGSTIENIQSGEIYILINGVEADRSNGATKNTSNQSYIYFNISSVVHLNAGDKVTIGVTQFNYGPITANTSGYSSFSGHIVYAD